jgi:hypothetical protein
MQGLKARRVYVYEGVAKLVAFFNACVGLAGGLGV